MFQWCRSRVRDPNAQADVDSRGDSPFAVDCLPSGVPHIHTHNRCGAVTLMDDDVIRSHLATPLTTEDQIYCAGCRDYFHAGEFTWDATAESVLEYFGRLRRESLRRVYGLRLTDRPAGVIVLPAAAKAIRRRAKANRWDKFYLSLKLLLDGSFAVEIVDVRHRVTETVVDAAVPIILERDQVTRMQGLVVEHCAGRGDCDLVVTRLHG